MAVTEIGTGTGYNAGILGRLAGDENVLSIDVVPDLVAAARNALDAGGHHKITTVCADGGNANLLQPDSADRLIATCGVDDLPEAWRRAVRPGGRIVAPIGAGVAVLDVDEQHGTQGSFLPTGAFFMQLRAADGNDLMPRPADPDGPTEPCAMPLDAWSDTDFAFRVSFALPLADVLSSSTEGELIVWHRDESIARIMADGTAQQAGPRRLADMLGHLWDSFREHGSPTRDAYRITIAPDGARTVVAEVSGRTWPVMPIPAAETA